MLVETIERDKMMKMVVSETISISEALAMLDLSGEKVLFVCNENLILKGVLSDGDIRKHILKNGTKSDSIYEVYNRNPITFGKSYTKDSIRLKMLEANITCIPIVDERSVLVEAISWNLLFDDRIRQKERNLVQIPVVIMAGGKGSRLAPFTDVLPKPLIPICGTPMVEVIIEKFISYGAKEFYLTVNYKKNIIKAYFEYSVHRQLITYVEEDSFLGTAGSLSILPDDIGDSFVVTNCDVLLDIDFKELIEFHKSNDFDITIVGCTQKHTIPYGVLSVCDNVLLSLDEKPQLSYITSTGVYVVNKRVISSIDAGASMDMTELITLLMESNRRIGVFFADANDWYDLGQWNEYEKSSKALSSNEYFNSSKEV